MLLGLYYIPNRNTAFCKSVHENCWRWRWHCVLKTSNLPDISWVEARSLSPASFFSALWRYCDHKICSNQTRTLTNWYHSYIMLTTDHTETACKFLIPTTCHWGLKREGLTIMQKLTSRFSIFLRAIIGSVWQQRHKETTAYENVDAGVTSDRKNLQELHRLSALDYWASII